MWVLKVYLTRVFNISFVSYIFGWRRLYSGELGSYNTAVTDVLLEDIKLTLIDGSYRHHLKCKKCSKYQFNNFGSGNTREYFYHHHISRNTSTARLPECLGYGLVITQNFKIIIEYTSILFILNNDVIFIYLKTYKVHLKYLKK